MKPYLVSAPKFVQWLFPKRIWHLPNTQNSVYLTFDDGPIREVTPWVLDLLQEYKAKATFFCIGENIARHPALFLRILQEGHSIGNHTQHHLRSTKTNAKTYLENISQATEQAKRTAGVDFQYFRPPYGKLSTSKALKIIKKGYKIVMWDTLSADFDMNISEEKCLKNVVNNLQVGSIVVFHDSLKAEKNLRYALPRTLEFIKQKGWNARAMPSF